MLLPNNLLRSCIQLTKGDAGVEDNLRVLSQELALDGIDGYLVEHLSHMQDLSREVPTLAQVRDWCTRSELRGDPRGSACAARLEHLEEATLLQGADFQYALREFKEGMLREGVGAALMEATAIMTTGLQIQVKQPGGRWGPKNLLGAEAALEQLSLRVGEIGSKVRGNAIEGEVRTDVTSFQREMARRAANPNAQGVCSGIKTIDDTHNGLQDGQLAFVLGFTSHNKSTLCFNWAYHAAVIQGKNVALVSLEMSAFAFQTALNLMHCKHERFDAKRGKIRITSDKIRTGMFTEQEQKFFQMVMDDLKDNPDYGRVFYREGHESITMTDIQRWAERLNRDTRLDLLVIDYLGLVDLGPNQSGMQDSASLNRVVRHAKRVANSFANGRGIPILSPFQANRDGYDYAEKNGGHYRLTAMAWASEAEKSADLVYYVYLDEGLQQANELVIGNLKNREGKVFSEQVKVFADPDYRTIQDLADGGVASMHGVNFQTMGVNDMDI